MADNADIRNQIDASDPLTDQMIYQYRVLTGGRQVDRYLLFALRHSIDTAESIDIVVSFLMESGVRLLIADLRQAVERGVPIRILTGNYLGITQPSALYLLRSTFGDKIDLRFYTDAKRSFHAKSYIFHYPDHNEVYVGSSNLSKSALTDGIEWNYRLSDQVDPRSYRRFYKTFEDLFGGDYVEIIDDAVLRAYSQNWHRPAVFKDLDRYDRHEDPDEKKTGSINLYEPRGAQIEALYQLEQSRMEGAGKALVQAATGVGKTYLAAFDSRSFRRVLFVAHRHEILQQAARSFHNVRPSNTIGFFEGSTKDTDAQLIFASVETLGRQEYLNDGYFAPDAFDYIVIDEFHHAVTDGYRRIIGYFKPKFLLGLTATPERMDGRDIYELCDYNVPYELSLRDAINKGYLCPFHYYGVYDDTDYSKLHLVRGHYEEKELNEIYVGNTRRYELIAKYYNKYSSERALGFCCSRQHAEDMAREFNARGIPSAAVYSGEMGPNGMDRDEALQALRTGKVKVLFSVDMFNEGLDVPDVDMVLFLRPTESPIVFLQQLGRGLRKAPGKEYLIVLDFIGNYEKAGAIPLYLTGDGRDHGNRSGNSKKPGAYPDDCIVDFDMKLIDLFRKLGERGKTVQKRIDEEVDRIRDELGHVPSRMELFTGMDESIYRLCLSTTKNNLFRDYLGYLKKREDMVSPIAPPQEHWLTKEEQGLCSGIAKEFLDLISTTMMSKIYKMPILYTFYNDGQPVMAITDEMALKEWKHFFDIGTNWKDLPDVTTLEQYQSLSDAWHLKKMHEMPIHFLQQPVNKGFFVQKPGYALALKDGLEEVIREPAFIRQFKDILDYRTMDYYRRRYVDRKMGVHMFDMKVNKSLLRDGFAIPGDKVGKFLKAIDVTLEKGQKIPIKAEVDGEIYYVKLVSLNLKDKYEKDVRVQIRYGAASEIAQHFRELYGDEPDDSTDSMIQVYAVGKEMIRIEH